MKFLQKFFNSGRPLEKVEVWDIIIDSSLETIHISMKKMLKVVKSRTFWTLVAMFITNGISGIREHLNPGWLTTIDSVLGILAVYFHVNPSQNYHE
jgi:hypothetical protein